MKARKKQSGAGRSQRRGAFSLLSKGSRPLWVFAAMVALLLVPVMWHLTREGLAEIVVYANPKHPCCKRWIEYLKASGFWVLVEPTDDVDAMRHDLQVPAHLAACHTAVTVAGGEFVIEGHVPAQAIRRLLSERPAVRGVAVPGMPAGAPGLEAREATPYEVRAFDADGRTMLFERVPRIRTHRTGS